MWKILFFLSAAFAVVRQFRQGAGLVNNENKWGTLGEKDVGCLLDLKQFAGESKYCESAHS